MSDFDQKTEMEQFYHEEERKKCPLHSPACWDECILEVYPDEDEGYICPRSGLPALGGE